MEQPAIIPGTKVRLNPPNNFLPATRFSGYEEPYSNASIMVTEMPSPFSELSSGLTNIVELAKKGLLLIEQEEIIVSQRQAILLKVQQTAYEGRFFKWILLLGNQTESLIVTASFPTTENELEYLLKESLVSLQWDSTYLTPFNDGLNFSLHEQGDLKLAARLSNSLLYTKGGIIPATSIEDPVFVCVPSYSQKIVDKEIFAQNRIFATDNITEITIIDSREKIIDNLIGYEIIAQGQDIKSNIPLMIYQVILFDDNFYYYLMQGLVGIELQQNYLPIFKAIAYSFAHK